MKLCSPQFYKNRGIIRGFPPFEGYDLTTFWTEFLFSEKNTGFGVLNICWLSDFWPVSSILSLIFLNYKMGT